LINAIITYPQIIYHMDKNLPNKSVLPENVTKVEPVTREEVQARARELALIDGRTPPDVSQADYEQAKRELTDESDLDRQEAVLDAIPEEKRGEPVPTSTGNQVPESPSDDEDEEGRSESEQLAEKGVEKAEHDQVLQAAIDTAKKDREESRKSTNRNSAAKGRVAKAPRTQTAPKPADRGFI
jgi:hypothetical protein